MRPAASSVIVITEIDLGLARFLYINYYNFFYILITDYKLSLNYMQYKLYLLHGYV